MSLSSPENPEKGSSIRIPKTFAEPPLQDGSTENCRELFNSCASEDTDCISLEEFISAVSLNPSLNSLLMRANTFNPDPDAKSTVSFGDPSWRLVVSLLRGISLCVTGYAGVCVACGPWALAMDCPLVMGCRGLHASCVQPGQPQAWCWCRWDDCPADVVGVADGE